MRIDGFLPSLSPDRGPRSGTAVTPFREAQREIEASREQPAPRAASQGLELQPQMRRVEPALSNGPTSSHYAQPKLSSLAAQALASYGETASYRYDADVQQVLGIDLYA